MQIMRLEDQVCSLELSKRLRELGVKQESLLGWFHEGNHFWTYWSKNGDCGADAAFAEEVCAAFTVAELGEMLPVACSLTLRSSDGAWLYPEKAGQRMREFTEADARAKCLIYLIEKGIFKVNDL